MKKNKTDDKRLFLAKYGLEGYRETMKKWFEYCSERSMDWKACLLENPYRLIELDKVGFNYVDSIARKLGVEKNNVNRIRCYTRYALDEMTGGSTILELSKAVRFIADKLEIDNAMTIVEILTNPHSKEYILLDDKYKPTKNFPDMAWVTKSSWYRVEKGVYNLCVKANKIKELKYDINVVERVKERLPFKLNTMQNYAVDNILKGGVNILTGGAGVGKTFTTKAILQVLQNSGQTFTVMAPTGIASKVFSESTGYECSTIHRAYYNQEIIETDWLVLEESSMLSCDHFELILSMVGERPVKLLLIGDISQLQPISPGSILRDILRLIDKGTLKGNVIRLTEVMRASDETFIPHLCKKFTRLDNYCISNENKRHKAVAFRPLANNVIDQVVDIVEKCDFDFRDTYILTPQKIGDIGADIINKYIDENITGGEPVLNQRNKQYRIGSIIMHTKNNANMNIFNGERLILVEARGEGKDRTFVAEKISDGARVVYDEKTIIGQTMLSYVCTVHKTQGITAKNVIFIASKKHTFMLSRELVYTGLSRASEKLIILHDEGVLYRASKKEVVDIRKTFLGEVALLTK